MSSKAITLRLKTMAALQQQRGFIAKGVDMSAAAITSRLKMQSALTTLCLKLAKAKAPGVVKPQPWALRP